MRTHEQLKRDEYNEKFNDYESLIVACWSIPLLKSTSINHSKSFIF